MCPRITKRLERVPERTDAEFRIYNIFQKVRNLHRVMGGSKMPWLNSFVKYFVSTTGTGVAAWYLHPHLLDVAADVLNLNFAVRTHKDL